MAVEHVRAQGAFRVCVASHRAECAALERTIEDLRSKVCSLQRTMSAASEAAASQDQDAAKEAAAVAAARSELRRCLLALGDAISRFASVSSQRAARLWPEARKVYASGLVHAEGPCRGEFFWRVGRTYLAERRWLSAAYLFARSLGSIHGPRPGPGGGPLHMLDLRHLHDSVRELLPHLVRQSHLQDTKRASAGLDDAILELRLVCFFAGFLAWSEAASKRNDAKHPSKGERAQAQALRSQGEQLLQLLQRLQRAPPPFPPEEAENNGQQQEQEQQHRLFGQSQKREQHEPQQQQQRQRQAPHPEKQRASQQQQQQLGADGFVCDKLIPKTSVSATLQMTCIALLILSRLPSAAPPRGQKRAKPISKLALMCHSTSHMGLVQRDIERESRGDASAGAGQGYLDSQRHDMQLGKTTPDEKDNMEKEKKKKKKKKKKQKTSKRKGKREWEQGQVAQAQANSRGRQKGGSPPPQRHQQRRMEALAGAVVQRLIAARPSDEYLQPEAQLQLSGCWTWLGSRSSATEERASRSHSSFLCDCLHTRVLEPCLGAMDDDVDDSLGGGSAPPAPWQSLYALGAVLVSSRRSGGLLHSDVCKQVVGAFSTLATHLQNLTSKPEFPFRGETIHALEEDLCDFLGLFPESSQGTQTRSAGHYVLDPSQKVLALVQAVRSLEPDLEGSSGEAAVGAPESGGPCHEADAETVLSPSIASTELLTDEDSDSDGSAGDTDISIVPPSAIAGQRQHASSSIFLLSEKMDEGGSVRRPGSSVCQPIEAETLPGVIQDSSTFGGMPLRKSRETLQSLPDCNLTEQDAAATSSKTNTKTTMIPTAHRMGSPNTNSTRPLVFSINSGSDATILDSTARTERGEGLQLPPPGPPGPPGSLAASATPSQPWTATASGGLDAGDSFKRLRGYPGI